MTLKEACKNALTILKQVMEEKLNSTNVEVILAPQIRDMVEDTVKILNIGTNRCELTVQTQIRLLLKEQSDLGRHCLTFHQHPLEALLHCKIELFHF